MSVLILCLLLAGEQSSIEKLFDPQLNGTQRAGACYQLRGAKDDESIAAMGRALEDPELLSCAAGNLRAVGAVEALRGALSSKNEQVRATVARELGSFQRLDLLDALSRAAGDENLLVATNALAGLSQYHDRAVIPYLAKLAGKGGMVGDMAMDRLAAIDPMSALKVARELLASAQVPDQLYAMRIIGANGDRGDLPALRKIAASGQENLAQRSRGFGLMPPISLAKAAQTAIASIEGR